MVISYLEREPFAEGNVSRNSQVIEVKQIRYRPKPAQEVSYLLRKKSFSFQAIIHCHWTMTYFGKMVIAKLNNGRRREGSERTHRQAAIVKVVQVAHD